MRFELGFRRVCLLVPATAITTILWSSGAEAACVFAPTAGDDAYICDSGVSGGLSDPSGNNSLTFPAGGAGVINGNVTFGGGADRVTMASGQVTGAVSQGNGIDDFTMSGGQIGSLQQGDGYDTFNMSDGSITGAFEDGDYAVMSGGTIGRVDMKLADNFFYLQGGRIHGNLVTGFGLDTIDMSGGTVGGNISVSGGNDIMRLSGGTVGGEIRMSFGNDELTWDGGGAVFGSVLMGQDGDLATLRGLREATLSVTPSIDGGVGTDARVVTPATDVLIFDDTQSANGARYTNWEAIELTNGSSFTLDGRPLVLGGGDTLTGSLGIDTTSDIIVNGNAAIGPFGAGLARVSNAGTIYMSHAVTTPTDRLTISGDYVGLNGSVVLDTYLGTDGSASDRLLISVGTASGLTGLGIVNAGGPGASTSQSGIMVVQAINGGTTNGDAFALDRAVAAGAYEYLLFKGGVEANTGENWYLRSSLINVPLPPAPPPPEPPAPPPPAPPPPVNEPVPTPPDPGPVINPGPPVPDVEAPVVPADPPVVPPIAPQPIDPDPVLDPGVAAPTRTAPSAGRLSIVPPTSQARLPTADLLAGAAAVPLYRLEAATYAVVPVAALALGLQALGTLDERRGSQGNVVDDTQPGWLRVYGQRTEQSWTATVAPTFDGQTYGVQAGLDLLNTESDGYRTTGGVFTGMAGMSGDIRGFALGWADYDVGTLNLNSTQAGVYLTQVGPSGWYVDGVLMGSWLGGSATSTRDVGVDVSGLGLIASLEAGYPLPLAGGWTLEPQGQIIWQGLWLDQTSDSFADVRFSQASGATGRIGVRLDNRIALENGFIEPALFANLWQDFGSTETMLDADRLETRHDDTAVEVGVGFSAELAPKVSVFGNASYTRGLGSERTSGKAQFGLQVSF
ncbi:MAG: autotransporter outer rane beta-barrel protein [Devosia sp.]|uniref:autotransporter family protein n=1 Tax=Devosia sp. TaxID=1871048 RepID=UPI0026019908|nr:autotransporter outer membrane beta-barrel domain-containing protein [Devosia sp.]MDB5585851.1 autotransporter outer rane beta-barrel protein [Devosia sp.]